MSFLFWFDPKRSATVNKYLNPILPASFEHPFFSPFNFRCIVLSTAQTPAVPQTGLLISPSLCTQLYAHTRTRKMSACSSRLSFYVTSSAKPSRTQHGCQDTRYRALSTPDIVCLHSDSSTRRWPSRGQSVGLFIFLSTSPDTLEILISICQSE